MDRSLAMNCWGVTVWSAYPDQAFVARMRRSGFAVDQVKIRANPSGKGRRHIIWIATARSRAGPR